MAGEAVGVAADLLGQQSDVLDTPIRFLPGVAIGEDLVRPAVDGASEPCQLEYVRLGGVLKEHDQPPTGVSDEPCGGDLAQHLLGQDGGADFAEGAPATSTSNIQVMRLSESRPDTSQEHPASPAEQIAPAASVPELFLLNTASDIPDRCVGQLGRRGVIDHERRVQQVLYDGGPVARRRVERSQDRQSAPFLTALDQPTGEHVSEAALDDLEGRPQPTSSLWGV